MSSIEGKTVKEINEELSRLAERADEIQHKIRDGFSLQDIDELRVETAKIIREITVVKAEIAARKLK